MNHGFGWSLPPGCSLSAPGGPEDPARHAAELAEEKLADGLYLATRQGFTVAEILAVWREAAEDAHYDEAEELAKEAAFYAELLKEEGD